MALDTLEIFGEEFTNVTGIKATDDNDQIKTYIRPQGTKSISANGTGIDVTEYASVDVSVPSGQPNLQSKTYNVSSAGTATITADSGYDGLSSVAVSVPTGTLSDIEIPTTAFNATIDSNGIVAMSLDEVYSAIPVSTNGYVTATDAIDVFVYGTKNIQLPTRSSSDLTASGATVTVPSGYYSAQASKAVASGTEGTPTATKGTVSNHQVSVTPSVTNTAGYISGGTKNGTAVTVSASELVSGTYTVDSSGSKDVTNYASASVPAGTAGTPSASKGAVSNHSVSVTPSVTNATGWITGSTKTGTAVTVSASELVSGTLSVSDNGTSDCTNYASVNVNIPFVTYYTGTSDPASSLGSNGDIYLKVVS